MLAKDHFYLIITLLTGILSFIKHMKFDFKCPENIGVVINIIEMHPFNKKMEGDLTENRKFWIAYPKISKAGMAIRIRNCRFIYQ